MAIREQLNNADIGIDVRYTKIEFNVGGFLTAIECEVICDDGSYGAFSAKDIDEKIDRRYGFFRDYRPDAEISFATGSLDGLNMY